MIWRLLKHLAILGAILLISVLVLVLLLKDIETVYNVQANTEHIQFVTPDFGKHPVLYVNNGDYVGEDDFVPVPFRGSVELEPGVEVIVSRIGHGPATVAIRSLKDGGKVANLTTIPANEEERSRTFGFVNELVVTITDIDSLAEKGERHIFQFNGRVELGRDITNPSLNEVPSMLQQGSIQMTNRSYFSSAEFVSRTQELVKGDKITFTPSDVTPISLLTIDAEKGISCVLRVFSKQAVIKKMGVYLDNNLVAVAPNYYDRILNDSFFQALSIIIGGLALIIAVSTFYFDAQHYFNAPK